MHVIDGACWMCHSRDNALNPLHGRAAWLTSAMRQAGKTIGSEQPSLHHTNRTLADSCTQVLKCQESWLIQRAGHVSVVKTLQQTHHGKGVRTDAGALSAANAGRFIHENRSGLSCIISEGVWTARQMPTKTGKQTSRSQRCADLDAVCGRRIQHLDELQISAWHTCKAGTCA